MELVFSFSFFHSWCDLVFLIEETAGIKFHQLISTRGEIPKNIHTLPQVAIEHFKPFRPPTKSLTRSPLPNFRFFLSDPLEFLFDCLKLLTKEKLALPPSPPPRKFCLNFQLSKQATQVCFKPSYM